MGKSSFPAETLLYLASAALGGSANTVELSMLNSAGLRSAPVPRSAGERAEGLYDPYTALSRLLS